MSGSWEGAGAGDLVIDSARELSLCGWARVISCNEALSMLEMVSVKVQKRGGEFFQTMGRVSVMATNCSP